MTKIKKFNAHFSKLQNDVKSGLRAKTKVDKIEKDIIPAIKTQVKYYKDETIFQVNKRIQKAKNLIFHNIEDINSKDNDIELIKKLINNLKLDCETNITY